MLGDSGVAGNEDDVDGGRKEETTDLSRDLRQKAKRCPNLFEFEWWICGKGKRCIVEWNINTPKGRVARVQLDRGLIRMNLN